MLDALMYMRRATVCMHVTISRLGYLEGHEHAIIVLYDVLMSILIRMADAAVRIARLLG
jgi:hypothetical protein